MEIQTKIEIKCKKCGKDISMKTMVLWTGHKVDGEYLCKECFEKAKNAEAKPAEKK